MSLSVTNTLTGEQEPFEVDDDEVLLYVCGLTVSDDAHLGHARSWVQADFVHRWLAHEGYDVRHVENVTDVNEKIAARAGEAGLGDTEPAVATHFTGSILRDMRGLNLLRAEVYPRVSEHIDAIVTLVERLLERGYAYESNGSIYFDVTTFEEYGRLSNQRVDELEAQGADEELADKRHPADFALWKAGGVDAESIREHRKDDRPVDDAASYGETFDSPWGEGRPGWHIECSAMSTTHLGDTIDIHMGGQDLVFPHHENEIAQSEAATGQEFVRYWLHVGLLESGADGEKMSSSLGNFFTVSDALEEFGVDVLRTFFAGASYRTRQTYSAAALAEAEERYDRLSRAYERACDAADGVDAYATVVDEDLRTAVDEAREGFTAAMNDDFNVREATAALLELATAVNRHLESRDRYDYHGLYSAIGAFDELGGEVLGLTFGEGTDGTVDLAEELVELVLEVRESERAAGNYDRADDLRDELEALGIEVQDSADGPTYRFPDR
jgi:cysteinyl-tRNA synthetase